MKIKMEKLKVMKTEVQEDECIYYILSRIGKSIKLSRNS